MALLLFNNIKRAQEASRATQDENERKEAAKKARKEALARYKELHPIEWAQKEAEKAAAVIAKRDFKDLCSVWHIDENNAEVGSSAEF